MVLLAVTSQPDLMLLALLLCVIQPPPCLVKGIDYPLLLLLPPR